MAKPLYIDVVEDRKELKSLLANAKPIMRPRLVMLLEMHKAGASGITKAELMQRVGVCGQSINHWRKAYRQGGIDKLLSHKRTGFKPSVFSACEQEALKILVNNPANGIVGYVELQKWVSDTFHKEVKYSTLNNFMKRIFKTKIKVARKSHIKKDEAQVDALKKTLVQSAKQRYKKLITNTLQR
jgi:transposase